FLTSFLPKFCIDICQGLSYGNGWSRSANQPIFMVKCAPERNFFVDVHQDLSYEAGWSQRVNQPIFMVTRTPQQVNPPFCQFLCAIVNGSFGDLYFRCHFHQKKLWTSVKTCAMESVYPDKSFGDPNFRRQFCRNVLWTSFKTLAIESIGPDGKTSPF
ncbi:hypothetical protein H5410_056561, partial [Solanum commersonii]